MIDTSKLCPWTTGVFALETNGCICASSVASLKRTNLTSRHGRSNGAARPSPRVRGRARGSGGGRGVVAPGAARRRAPAAPGRRPRVGRAGAREPPAVGVAAARRARVDRRGDARAHHGLPRGGQRARLARRPAARQDLRDGRTARRRGRGAGLDGLRAARVAARRRAGARADARRAARAVALPRRQSHGGDRAAPRRRAAPVRPRRLRALRRARARRRPLRHHVPGDPQRVRAAGPEAAHAPLRHGRVGGLRGRPGGRLRDAADRRRRARAVAAALLPHLRGPLPRAGRGLRVGAEPARPGRGLVGRAPGPPPREGPLLQRYC